MQKTNSTAFHNARKLSCCDIAYAHAAIAARATGFTLILTCAPMRLMMPTRRSNVNRERLVIRMQKKIGGCNASAGMRCADRKVFTVKGFDNLSGK